MMIPRPYQEEAIQKGVEFFKDQRPGNGLEICPTGSGKSLIIANIAKELEGNTVVFQPSKEILEQNYAKYIGYGNRAGIYSASLGSAHVDKVTFATIGSVARKKHLFRRFRNIIVDECHQVNASEGLYKQFFDSIGGAKILGLTATPYRLQSDAEGAKLVFLNRSYPRVFKKVVYYIQNETLFNNGFLAPLQYHTHEVIDRTMLETNSSGTDFAEASLRSYMRQINIASKTVMYAQDILQTRKNLLIFCPTIEDAIKVSRNIPGSEYVTGDMDTVNRSRILTRFKNGDTRCLVNVGVVVTGFDYPALEAALIARSTMSLAWYYQAIGRVMRPFKLPDGSIKVGHITDLGGNVRQFGRIETMKIRVSEKGNYSIWNNGRQLTDIGFQKIAL